MRSEPNAAGQSFPRAALVTLAALIAALGVAAVSLNRLPYGQRPQLAAALWPDFPAALHDQAMRDIGLAAAREGTVPAQAVAMMHHIARRDPLDPDPFLVQATVALTAGDDAAAERMFAEAAARDPRSVLARYSLADRYLRTDRLQPALEELAILARLVPAAAMGLAQPLAAFARQPGTTATLKRFFATSPGFAGPVLEALAKDPVQADRVIALGQGLNLPPEASGWKSVLVQAQIERKDYPGALALWRRIAGVGPVAGVFNPGFRALPAPPPFNWNSSGGTAAMVEPIPSGGLRLVYYGREDSELTRQLVILAPGRYRLAMSIADLPARARGNDDGVRLGWQVSCSDGGATIASLPLAGRGAGPVALDFAVPAGCPAQWLALRGTAGSFGEPVSLTLTGLSLTRAIGQ